LPSLQIRFSQIDPAAKQDINTLSSSVLKPWSNLNDLRFDSVEYPMNAATCEWNYSILDGLMEEFPDNTSGKLWGLWSSVFSNQNGIFTTPPYLDIVFHNIHKSNGLTLYFYPHTDDYAKEILVTWYDTADNVLASGIFQGDSNIVSIPQYVEGYDRIVIKFLSTNIPYRYIKLYAIDFGLIRILNDSEVSTCRVIEEVDPTNESMSVNVLDAVIRSKSGIFSPIIGDNPSDTVSYQPLQIIVDGHQFGTFFLSNWEDVFQSGIEFNISADDALGILDIYPFVGGIYTNKKVVELLDEIFNITFPTELIKYNLDSYYVNSTVTGWIPHGTCGLALQLICFAINATVDTEKNGNVWIYPTEIATTYNIELNQQYRRGKFGFTEYFSGVDITSYNYVPGTETAEVFNGLLSPGQHTIKTSEPLHSYTATNATILSSGANYVRINVASNLNILISGLRYIDNARVYSVRNQVELGQIENIKIYDGYTLITPQIALSVANRRLNILSKRIKAEVAARRNDFEVGYIANVKTQGRTINGLITKANFNLRGDMVDMEVIGNAVG